MKEKKKNKFLVYGLVVLTFLSVIFYLAMSVINSGSKVDQISSILSVSLFSLFAIIFVIYSFNNIKKGKEYGIVILGSILLTMYSLFNLGVVTDSFSLPTQKYVEDFTNKNLTEVVKWASSNNITLNQVYETSDLVDEYNIISQSVTAGTLTKEIKEMTVVVSEGPNLDKEITMPIFVGKNVDDVIKFVEDNFLTGVNIDFTESEIERDNIIEQDKSGIIRRNDTVNLVASIGSIEDIGPMDMEELTGKDLFHSLTWLKRYGFKYKLEYEYSDTIEKGLVIKQSVDVGSNVNPLETEVILTISKGPKIIVPNLQNMSTDEITAWIIENNLKVEFKEMYDDTIELGAVVEVSVNEGDEVESGTLITVTISKGPIKMEKFTSFAEFKAWAELYEVSYNENYEFSDSVSSGNIISTSINEGEIIKNNDTINIVVSQGKSSKVPNFVGKTKSEITKLCSSSNLKCSFNYGGFSDSVAKDVAISQSKKSGSTVSSGASIVITLSSGKASSYTVVIQSTWLSPGDPDATISTLKSKLSAACPGVTFNFTKKTVNTGVGLITQDSPVKGGSNTFIQGKTYNIYVGKS